MENLVKDTAFYKRLFCIYVLTAKEQIIIFRKTLSNRTGLISFGY